MKKMILIVTISFMTLFVLFFSQNHYFELESPEIDFGTEIALTVNGLNTTTFPKKESNLKVKNISCNEGIGYWDYSSWSLRVREIKNAKVKCNIDFVNEYHESILNGTDPILKDNLIPVTIENDGTVKRAKLGSEWYSYEKKNWANAIILESDSKTYYEGEIIPESNIESYFVWIPRYKYKIFNEGKYTDLTKVENKVQQIEVVFENKYASSSNGSTVGTWLTHLAFTSFNSNGMWVGKFETGFKGAKEPSEARKNIYDTSKVQIKPNVNSWCDVIVSNAHLNSYNYQRNLDSHMMKNTEWGAVAYLSHSKYGSQKSVRINNNVYYLTGYAAVNEPTCGHTATNETCNQYGITEDITQPYNTSSGYAASTTANITGIYDMSGGAYEYVMGVMLDKNGQPMSGRNSNQNSGFNGVFGCPTCDSDTSSKTSKIDGINFPDKKYFDSYTYEENYQSFQRRILGDATGELGPFDNAIYITKTRQISSWYADETWFVTQGLPWSHRGGVTSLGTGSGIFQSGNQNGAVNSWTSYRIVLSL